MYSVVIEMCSVVIEMCSVCYRCVCVCYRCVCVMYVIDVCVYVIDVCVCVCYTVAQPPSSSETFRFSSEDGIRYSGRIRRIPCELDRHRKRLKLDKSQSSSSFSSSSGLAQNRLTHIGGYHLSKTLGRGRYI